MKESALTMSSGIDIPVDPDAIPAKVSSFIVG